MKRFIPAIVAVLLGTACIGYSAWYGADGTQEGDATSVGGTPAADMATDAEVAAADTVVSNAAVVYTDGATNNVRMPTFGALNSTNGVYWVSHGTNYWILFEL